MTARQRHHKLIEQRTRVRMDKKRRALKGQPTDAVDAYLWRLERMIEDAKLRARHEDDENRRQV